MTDLDYYYTGASESEIEIKIKGSRFIGRLFLVQSAEEAEEQLARLRKQYYDATHHCYAYRTGIGVDPKFRDSDDGEPNGTAGKPIFDRIEGPNITNTLIVVTRYYGGTKLGTGGLTHAYSDAAGEALKKAGITKKYITSKYRIFLDFPDYNNVERLVLKYKGEITKSDFSERVALIVELRNSVIERFLAKLTDMTSGRAKYEPEI